MTNTRWYSLGLVLAALTVGCGKDSTGPDPVDNNAAPTADFISSCTDLSCSFTDLSSDSDGQVTAHAWQFGTEGASPQKNPSHTFSTAGQFNVSLTVTDDQGREGTVTRSVSLTVPPAGAPVADFQVTCFSLNCTFEDLSTHADGTIVAWAWEFGDGTNSALQNPPVHHYDVTTRTLIMAELTVTDAEGLSSTKTTEFTVSPPAELLCESAPGTGQFASCELELLADATVTVTLESRSCDAHGNTFQITAPLAQTLFTDGCYAAVGEPFNLNGGNPFAAGTRLDAQVISGATNQMTAPAVHVTGAYPTWTLSFDDGVAGPGEPDFDDLVITVTADPVD